MITRQFVVSGKNQQLMVQVAKTKRGLGVKLEGKAFIVEKDIQRLIDELIDMQGICCPPAPEKAIFKKVFDDAIKDIPTKPEVKPPSAVRTVLSKHRAEAAPDTAAIYEEETIG